jgi:hypothetical protein
MEVVGQAAGLKCIGIESYPSGFAEIYGLQAQEYPMLLVMMIRPRQF